MDLYILDEQLRRESIVDRYESLIWTERHAAHGDFELVIRSELGTRSLFPTEARLVIPQSHRVMVVETIEDGTDDDGIATLKISGRSLETTLEERSNHRSLIADGRPIVEDNQAPDTPGNIVRTIFDSICRNNDIIPGDNIPFIMPGSLLPTGSIPEPTEIVTYRYKFDTLYNTIKDICDIYNLGFRLVRNGDTSELYFDVYTGNDRTSLQDVNSNVIFSPELDNLSDTTELTSVAGAKNVAYVNGKNASRVVYADNVEPTISGFDRHVLVVDATNIDLAAGAELDAALEQRGKEELSKHRPVIAFDGEIPQSGSYKYGVDYALGDLVEMRNAEGMATNMRVTEQIFISDREGERSYPTLTTNLVITPGSWYAWDASQVWEEADGYWADA